jgi:uncharacterized membrane protein
MRWTQLGGPEIMLSVSQIQALSKVWIFWTALAVVDLMSSNILSELLVLLLSPYLFLPHLLPHKFQQADH